MARQTKIMIVDDEENLVQIIQTRLEKNGYEVIPCCDSRQALVIARERHPDLVILDILMPDPDGMEVSRMLHQDPLTRDIPVIFLTALKKKEEETLSARGKPQTILAKPFDAVDLIREIESKTADGPKR